MMLINNKKLSQKLHKVHKAFSQRTQIFEYQLILFCVLCDFIVLFVVKKGFETASVVNKLP